ncbi:MAG TPA: hypothetical protein VHT95_12945 [Vicinamibacterales bacterium]|nr:hypothetical protein [Vicinamibacterales bacterium]
MTRRPLLAAVALLTVLTVIITWPMALHIGTRVPGHDDPLFSIWRLAWVAHALPHDPRHLFDANIFYPHLRTLAYSDAMLLQGIVAAPLLWMGTNRVLVYNLMFLTGIVSSGAGMFVLVRYLTGDIGAALVSAVIFTLAPYRIEHFIHLELQWTVWMPLALWAVHRTVDQGRFKNGALTGFFLWLQVISCVYYGAFLGVIVSALALLLLASRPERARHAIGPLSLGALVAAMLTWPYALPYLAAMRELGPRPSGEVLQFSAAWGSYLAAPHQNWLWGWTAWGFGGNERHLFPGVASVLLAVAGLAWRPRRMVLIYAALTLLAVDLSLGLNSAFYRWLYEHIFAFRGFRAPARFAILACCAMSVLAGFGYRLLQQLLAARPVRRALLIAVLVVVVTESGSSPLELAAQPTMTPPVYRFLRTVAPSVILELPAEDYEPTYMFWSTYHWHWLVNGYSGYTPGDHVETMSLMATFPDDESLARLRELGVRYVLVHQALYQPDDFADLMSAIAERAELIPVGHYRDWLAGDTQMIELRR